MGIKQMRYEVSFKQNEEWLWKLISQKSSPNAFTKDLLKEHFQKTETQKKPTLPMFRGE